MLSKSDNMFEVLRSEIDDPAELHELLQLMREKKRKKLIWTRCQMRSAIRRDPRQKSWRLLRSLLRMYFVSRHRRKHMRRGAILVEKVGCLGSYAFLIAL